VWGGGGEEEEEVVRFVARAGRGVRATIMWNNTFSTQASWSVTPASQGQGQGQAVGAQQSPAAAARPGSVRPGTVRSPAGSHVPLATPATTAQPAYGSKEVGYPPLPLLLPPSLAAPPGPRARGVVAVLLSRSHLHTSARCRRLPVVDTAHGEPCQSASLDLGAHPAPQPRLRARHKMAGEATLPCAPCSHVFSFPEFCLLVDVPAALSRSCLLLVRRRLLPRAPPGLPVLFVLCPVPRSPASARLRPRDF